MEPDEFERQARERLGEGVYEKDGFLTEEALEELKKALPEARARRAKASRVKRVRLVLRAKRVRLVPKV